MTDVTTDELQEALRLWVDIQITDPEGIARYLHSHENPFIPLPPEKEKIDAFILLARSILPEGVQKLPEKPFDAYMREEFVKEYVDGAKMAKTARSQVELRTKKFLEENFRIAFTPNAPELKEKVAPDQRVLLLVNMNAVSKKNPDEKIGVVVNKAMERSKVDLVFMDKSSISGQIPMFSNLPGLTPPQKVEAQALDAVISDADKPLVMARAERMAVKNYLEGLVGTAEEEVVEQQWFQSLLQGAQAMVIPETTAGGVPSVYEGLAANLFQKSLEQTVISYAPVVEPTFPSVPVLGVTPGKTTTRPIAPTTPSPPVTSAFTKSPANYPVSPTNFTPSPTNFPKSPAASSQAGGKEPLKGAKAVIAAIASAMNRTNAAKPVGVIKPSGANPAPTRGAPSPIAAPAIAGKPILISTVVVAYIEWYRISVSQGLPPPTFAQFQAAHLGIGSQAFHIGTEEMKRYAIRRAQNGLWGGIKNLFLSFGKKTLSTAAIATKASNPLGWAALALGWIISLRPGKGRGPGAGTYLALGLVVGLVAVAVIFPLIVQDTINSSLAIRLPMYGGGTGSGSQSGSDGSGPGSGGVIAGPVIQTAPISGPLTCFNTTTQNPLSNGQVGVLSNTLQSSDAQSIGLYNCILNCPQNQIDLHAGGQSKWYGYATPGNITFYDGVFAANNHDRARNIAHELAHQWAYANPNIIDQFQQEGYCGKLCTYPSGYLGKCSNLETIDETFAESAAMYLTGENLQSLCPKGYDFMDVMFKTCGGK